MRSLAARKKTLKNKLDKLWREAVLLKAGSSCAICGKNDGRLNAHHLIRRSRGKRFRWNIENGVCLCVNDHTMSADSAHAGGLAFADKFREMYPERAAWFDMANGHNKQLGPWKPTLEELEEIREDLEAIVEEYR